MTKIDNQARRHVLENTDKTLNRFVNVIYLLSIRIHRSTLSEFIRELFLGGWAFQRQEKNSGERLRFSEQWLIGDITSDQKNAIVQKVYDLTAHIGDLEDLIDDLLYDRYKLVKTPRPLGTFLQLSGKLSISVSRRKKLRHMIQNSELAEFDETSRSIFSGIGNEMLSITGKFDCLLYKVVERFFDSNEGVRFEEHQYFDVMTLAAILESLLRTQKPNQMGLLRINGEATSFYLVLPESQSRYEVSISSQIIGRVARGAIERKWCVTARQTGTTKQGKLGHNPPIINGVWLVCSDSKKTEYFVR